MPLAPNTRHHDSCIFTKLGNRHDFLLSRFRLIISYVLQYMAHETEFETEPIPNNPSAGRVVQQTTIRTSSNGAVLLAT